MSDTQEMVLDVRGLSCPLPVLRTNKELKRVPTGAVLTVLASDPASLRDMPAFCTQTGHELLDTVQQDDGAYVFRIRCRPRG